MIPINKMIDHTLLKSTATLDEIDSLCDEALTHEFASVCINPMYIPHAFKKLKNTNVAICTVVGFPLGASRTSIKAAETLDAIDAGASEIDMVIPIGLLKSGKLDLVRYDIEQITRICKSKNTILKVILETCFLSEQEISDVVAICNDLEVDFVKTSTGFGTHGATVEHVSLLRKLCNKNIQIKASGGIKTKEDAMAMINAGATRIGTSNGLAIIDVSDSHQDY